MPIPSVTGGAFFGGVGGLVFERYELIFFLRKFEGCLVDSEKGQRSQVVSKVRISTHLSLFSYPNPL